MKSWRWFLVRLLYLLQVDCPLSRRFQAEPERELPSFMGGD